MNDMKDPPHKFKPAKITELNNQIVDCGVLKEFPERNESVRNQLVDCKRAEDDCLEQECNTFCTAKFKRPMACGQDSTKTGWICPAPLSKMCETLTAQCSESECKEYCIEKKRKAHAACNVSDDQLCILPKMAKGAKQNATFVCQVSALCM